MSNRGDIDAEIRLDIRVTRGAVLNFLHRWAGHTPPTVLYSSIEKVVRAKSRRLLDEALSYLVAAGYIERIEDKLDFGDNEPLVLFQLSAKGFQLAERVITDPSVEF